MNPAASELLGVAIERGRPLGRPWPAAVLADGNDERGAHTTDIETARGRCLRVQRAALRAAGARGASLIVVSDRTAERNREASERRFLANASHELRTPLAAIVAAVEVLEAGAKDDVAARDTFLADLQHEAHRLQRLTERLLTRCADGLRLAPAGAPGRRRSRRASRTSPSSCSRSPNPAPSRSRPPATRRAVADPDILDQVLVGLVGNALKHTPRGRHRPPRRRRDGDDGPQHHRRRHAVSGIPEHDLPQVFDRFWRGDDARRAGGFGLGLGICREYVEAMGGTISIRSQPGAERPSDRAPRQRAEAALEVQV